ncbi:hypothetical protein FRC08_000285, partial [Ceratobasidium sp. 394]
MTHTSAAFAHHITPRTLAPSAMRTHASSSSPGRVLVLELVLSAPTRSRAFLVRAHSRHRSLSRLCSLSQPGACSRLFSLVLALPLAPVARAPLFKRRACP